MRVAVSPALHRTPQTIGVGSRLALRSVSQRKTTTANSGSDPDCFCRRLQLHPLIKWGTAPTRRLCAAKRVREGTLGSRWFCWSGPIGSLPRPRRFAPAPCREPSPNSCRHTTLSRTTAELIGIRPQLIRLAPHSRALRFTDPNCLIGQRRGGVRVSARSSTTSRRRSLRRFHFAV